MQLDSIAVFMTEKCSNFWGNFVVCKWNKFQQNSLRENFTYRIEFRFYALSSTTILACFLSNGIREKRKVWRRTQCKKHFDLGTQKKAIENKWLLATWENFGNFQFSTSQDFWYLVFGISKRGMLFSSTIYTHKMPHAVVLWECMCDVMWLDGTLRYVTFGWVLHFVTDDGRHSNHLALRIHHHFSNSFSFSFISTSVFVSCFHHFAHQLKTVAIAFGTCSSRCKNSFLTLDIQENLIFAKRC